MKKDGRLGLNLLPLGEVANHYQSYLAGERRLRKQSTEYGKPFSSTVGFSPRTMHGTVGYLMQVARSSLTPRGYSVPYGLLYQHAAHIWQDDTETPVVLESVAAHTNLMSAMLDLALARTYGQLFGDTSESLWANDGHTYREIMRAAHLHDLPENLIGDLLDNGSINEAVKAQQEQDYFENMRVNFSPRTLGLQLRAENLVKEMAQDDPQSKAGRLLKLADKSSAVLMCLLLDAVGQSPMLGMDAPQLSPRDRAEMEMCDYVAGDRRRASEMWTADLFNIRRFVRCDDTGFFTALIIMATLMVHGQWYSWRQKLYPPTVNAG